MTLDQTIGNTRSHTLFQNLAKGQLELNTTILEQKSCSLDHVGFKLRLTLRNVGKGRVILHREKAISRIMVSGNLAGAATKRYEQEQRFDDPGAVTGFDTPTLSNFTMLEPGEGINFEESVSVYLFKAKRRTEQFLRKGTHFLQVDVASGPYIADPAPFRSDWSEKGYLWFEGIISEPMAFTISNDRQITQCR